MVRHLSSRVCMADDDHDLCGPHVMEVLVVEDLTNGGIHPPESPGDPLDLLAIPSNLEGFSRQHCLPVHFHPTMAFAILIVCPCSLQTTLDDAACQRRHCKRVSDSAKHSVVEGSYECNQLVPKA